MNAQTYLKPPLPAGMAGTAVYTFRHQVLDNLTKPDIELSEEDIRALDEKFLECEGLCGEQRDAKCREIAEWIDGRASGAEG
jgi:hypothetical protein